MSDRTALIGRCTIQRANGTFCDATAMEDLPYPVCGRHAFALLRHMIAMIGPELEGEPGLLRIRSALDWVEGSPTRGGSRPPIEGVVYYLQVDGLIKIGFTGNIESRVREYPPSAVLLATEPGTMATERERHQQFGRHLTARREWFTPGADLLEHIEAIKASRAA